MSKSRSGVRQDSNDDDDDDPWKRLAEHEDTLEMLIEEDVPMAKDAEILLERLEEKGYR